MNPAPDELTNIERSLYKQLAAMALICVGVGGLLGAWGAAVSGAIGIGAAMFYFLMLSVQVRKRLSAGRVPNMLAILLSLFARQLVSLAAPAACFFLIGEGWWASLVTLLIARHWVLVAGRSRDTAQTSPIHA